MRKVKRVIKRKGRLRQIRLSGGGLRRLNRAAAQRYGGPALLIFALMSSLLFPSLPVLGLLKQLPIINLSAETRASARTADCGLASKKSF